MYEKQLCFFEYLQTLNPAQTLSIAVLTTEAQVIYLKGLIAETQIVKYNEHGGGSEPWEDCSFTHHCSPIWNRQIASYSVHNTVIMRRKGGNHI